MLQPELLRLDKIRRALLVNIQQISSEIGRDGELQAARMDRWKESGLGTSEVGGVQSAGDRSREPRSPSPTACSPPTSSPLLLAMFLCERVDMLVHVGSAIHDRGVAEAR